MEAVERQVGSKREMAQLFGVHESFLYKLLRQQRERGDLAPLPQGGGVPAKLSEEQWQQVGSWLTTTPDATLADLVNAYFREAPRHGMRPKDDSTITSHIHVEAPDASTDTTCATPWRECTSARRRTG